ncbi:MAG: T9SS type A sorting domain-containing protein, partial [Chitinophagaceae bacterium]
VPLYNSYPSASAVLFLDFDGHTVDATAWNYDGPIVCGASGLNSTQITEVFNRVAEDYRPFNINITTDSLKYLAAPVNKRMRVILTVTSEWFGAAGGVAFTGSFTWGDDTPCFVFSALLGNNTKNIGEASSHEAGHTLGLYHQSTYDANCVRVSEYNYGNGSGEIGWAPIMGVGYYRNLTLWNNGPNPYGCTNYQSDLDIITTGNGFTFRTDDYGNSFASSMVVPFTANQFLFSGVIEKNTDMDMIRFTLPVKGRFTLNAVPYNVGTGNSGSNLDLQVTLYNTAQAQLNVYNPAMILSSVIDSVMDAGTYYLKIEGRGNIYAPNYASLGSYSLQANFTGGVLPLRKLELRGHVSGDLHQLNWLIDADEQVVKQVLEFSTDGRNFNELTQPQNADRAFSYTTLSSTNILYRVNVTFDNGHQYYSNIISLQPGNKSKPKVVNSLVSTGILVVTSPALYAYNVYDMNGRVLGKGQIKPGQNSIPVSQYVPGMYIIEFNQGNDSYSEKFVRK